MLCRQDTFELKSRAFFLEQNQSPYILTSTLEGRRFLMVAPT
jgi:hypothetical protein